MELKIKVTGQEKLEKKLNILPGVTHRKLASELKKTLSGAVGYVIRNHLTGGTTRTRLGVRTGNLRRSIQYRVNENALSGEFGSYNTTYAMIHEKGGTLTAKRGQFLAIPISPEAKTKAGVFKSPRTFKNTFVKESRNGNKIIFQKKGKNIIPLFVLKRSVKIPARPFIKPTAEKYIIPQYSKKINEVLQQWQQA